MDYSLAPYRKLAKMTKIIIKFLLNILYVFVLLTLVSSLMRGGSGTMSSMSGQMGGLGTCSMDAKQQLHFPLSQRRKRRVLFTQAQVKS
jgi:hypothetical protein